MVYDGCLYCLIHIFLLTQPYNDRRGHRRLRLTSRKHFKAKSILSKSSRISISKQKVSELKVSLPIELVNFHVSVPISSFLNASVPNISVLLERLQSLKKIPQGTHFQIEFCA